jgi:hypothetical protein
MKKDEEVLKGRVLARVHADDLRKVAGMDAKTVASNGGRDKEVVSDPTWALSDHAI